MRHQTSCVYKVTYAGNRLPPYYIGSTYLDNIDGGYLGTPRSRKYEDTWRQETIDNPQLFRLEILSVHATRQEALVAEEIEQRACFELGDPLWVNQAYANCTFLGTRDGALKAAITTSRRGKTSQSRVKGHITRKLNGTDKTGCIKGIQTKIRTGVPIGGTIEGAAKRRATILGKGGRLGWSKESHARGIATKHTAGIFKIAAQKMAANAKLKAQRDNVLLLKDIISLKGIKLGKGWYKKSDQWINERIEELTDHHVTS